MAVACNIFGRNISNDTKLKDIDITLDEIIHKSNIQPEKLLHKCINSSDEEDALKLIEDNPDLDVNYILNDNIPVFNAIRFGLLKVFNAIISSKNFNINVADGFGEPILLSMIYAYAACGLHDDKNKKQMHEMIDSVLHNSNIDLNQMDINLDTPINVAIEDKSTMWIAQELVANKNVNINVINDYDRSALGNAIACDNIDGIKLLATRSDLVVREKDVMLAKRHNINLEDYIDMSQKGISVENVTETSDSSEMNKYMKILA